MNRPSKNLDPRTAQQIIQEKNDVQKKFEELTKKPLNYTNFKAGWNIISEKTRDRMWGTSDIGPLVKILFGAYQNADETTKTYAIEKLQELNSLIPTTVSTINLNFSYPVFVQNLATWRAIVEEAKKMHMSASGISSSRIQSGNGSKEFQHIGPWREKKELMLRVASINTGIRALTPTEKSAADASNPKLLQNLASDASSQLNNWYSPERSWREVVARVMHKTLLLIEAESTLSQTIQTNKRNNVGETTCNTSITIPSSTSFQEWEAFVENKNIAESRRELDELPTYFPKDVAHYIRIEFMTKAIVSAIKQANELNKLSSEELSSAEEHLDRLIQIAEKSPVLENLQTLTNRIKKVLKDYHNIIKDYKESSEQRKKPAETATVTACTTTMPTSYNSPYNEKENRHLQIIAQQQEQIAQLLNAQHLQQEQMKQLFLTQQNQQAQMNMLMQMIYDKQKAQ